MFIVLKLSQILVIAVIIIFIGCDKNDELSPIANFDFNKSDLVINKSNLNARAVGTSLVEDRFGNPESAHYLHGSKGSFLSLGNHLILKPQEGSISLWFNIDYPIEAGTGYDVNPILLTKCDSTDDFFEAYCVNFMYKTNRIGVAVTQSSLNQVGLHSSKPINLGKWHHVVIGFNKSELVFYLDGKLEGKIDKGFDISYLKNDSILIGYSNNRKNNRCFNGSVDDIAYFDRVLNQNEVEALFNAPDPYYYKRIIKYVVIILVILFIVTLIIVWINYRLKRKMALQNESKRIELLLKETEIKALKANMNPHFIFNALNSIQKFVLANDKLNAYNYLIMFSKLLRKTLESNVNESIKLSDEIEIINNYIELESLRFNQNFSFKVTVHESITSREYLIPQMLIQPFIENAIWHGLLLKEGERELIIDFRMLNENLLECTIEDNGIGRELARQNQSTHSKKSLAIYFNRQRLELINLTRNIDCGFEIIDKMNNFGKAAGTKVIVRIPIL